MESLPRPLVIRGFVVPRPNGTWYAHCIDLTIDALAPSREEAIDQLNRASVAYLEWASERRDVPVLRRSPLRFRLRYYRYAFEDAINAFRQRPRKPQVRHTFQGPLPA